MTKTELCTVRLLGQLEFNGTFNTV